jgi:hypothetical protein
MLRHSRVVDVDGQREMLLESVLHSEGSDGELWRQVSASF